MNINLYPCFEHWKNFNNIWIYSDPHFADEEMKYLRKNYLGDDEQVARINSKVGKKDLIIFLGDIGDKSFIKKIRGYKVLVMGNHDAGATTYQRKILKQVYDQHKITKADAIAAMRNAHPTFAAKVWAEEEYTFHAPFTCWNVYADNGLFDEVYEGPVVIADKILLSHEPINLPFFFNIHGHDHSNMESRSENSINLCAEHIDYTPVSLLSIIKSGCLGKVDNIHRQTIDRATASPKKKTHCNHK